jgi:peptidoglycan/LPS O-acetylase OafA/YrhL
MLGAVRGIAAATVALYHLFYWARAVRGYDLPVEFGAQFANFGVTCFFTLSGYLMFFVTSRDGAIQFLSRRIARIYPTYLVIVVGAFVVDVVVWHLGGPAYVPDVIGMIKANPARLTLWPLGYQDAPLSIEWTLWYEVNFYVTLTALMLCGLRRYLAIAMGAWIVIIIAAIPLGLPHNPFSPLWPEILLSSKNIPLATGFLGAYAVKRFPGFQLWPVLALGILLANLNANLSLAMIETAMILAAARETTKSSIFMAASDLGGRISYPLYLIHPTIFVAVFKLSPAGAPMWLVLSLGAASSLLIAIPLGRMDEWLHQSARRLFDYALTISVPLARRMGRR